MRWLGLSGRSVCVQITPIVHIAWEMQLFTCIGGFFKTKKKSQRPATLLSQPAPRQRKAGVPRARVFLAVTEQRIHTTAGARGVLGPVPSVDALQTLETKYGSPRIAPTGSTYT